MNPFVGSNPSALSWGVPFPLTCPKIPVQRADPVDRTGQIVHRLCLSAGPSWKRCARNRPNPEGSPKLTGLKHTSVDTSLCLIQRNIICRTASPSERPELDHGSSLYGDILSPPKRRISTRSHILYLMRLRRIPSATTCPRVRIPNFSHAECMRLSTPCSEVPMHSHGHRHRDNVSQDIFSTSFALHRTMF
jgi:hypothetical protein